jgi:hypothetical protein
MTVDSLILEFGSGRALKQKGGEPAKWEGKHVQKGIRLLWIVGFFGLLATANAQTPSSPTTTKQFDGTYVFVSSTKLNETYFSSVTEHIKRCGENRNVGPLAIANGQARYHHSGPRTEWDFEGTVGPQGELAMRLIPLPVNVNARPWEIMVSGRIDGSSTVSARQTGLNCQYDVVWRRQSK